MSADQVRLPAEDAALSNDKPGRDVLDEAGRGERCGAFGTTTGARCVRENDHDGPHALEGTEAAWLAERLLDAEAKLHSGEWVRLDNGRLPAGLPQDSKTVAALEGLTRYGSPYDGLGIIKKADGKYLLRSDVLALCPGVREEGTTVARRLSPSDGGRE